MEALHYFSSQPGVDADLAFYMNADYIPPTLAFKLSTAGFGCAMLVMMMWVGDWFGETKMAQRLATMGQMALSHYILSLTMGMLLLSFLSGKPYTSSILATNPTNPVLLVLRLVFKFYTPLTLIKK